MQIQDRFWRVLGSSRYWEYESLSAIGLSDIQQTAAALVPIAATFQEKGCKVKVQAHRYYRQDMDDPSTRLSASATVGLMRWQHGTLPDPIAQKDEAYGNPEYRLLIGACVDDFCSIGGRYRYGLCRGEQERSLL